jgi:hypothetical protein
MAIEDLMGLFDLCNSAVPKGNGNGDGYGGGYGY